MKDHYEYVVQTKDYCPLCEADLEQIAEDDTNAVLGVYCEVCGYEEKY